MKCRVYVCSREAAPGSEFCRVKHGWWEEPTAPVPVATLTRARLPEVVWTRERVIAAIQRWALEHGRAPTQNDWTCRGEHHPSSRTAKSRFGSWGDALRAAGFEPHCGRPPQRVAA